MGLADDYSKHSSRNFAGRSPHNVDSQLQLVHQRNWDVANQNSSTNTRKGAVETAPHTPVTKARMTVSPQHPPEGRCTSTAVVFFQYHRHFLFASPSWPHPGWWPGVKRHWGETVSPPVRPQFAKQQRFSSLPGDCRPLRQPTVLPHLHSTTRPTYLQKYLVVLVAYLYFGHVGIVIQYFNITIICI